MSKKTIKKEATEANGVKKEVVKKVEANVVDTKKAEPKKVEVKKAEVKPTEAKLATSKKTVVEAKAQPKKIATKKALEKITTKPEPKKIVAAKAPEKIATAKAPEKIAVKPEPKKIVEKKVEPTKEMAVKESKKVVEEVAKKATKKATPKKEAVQKVEKPAKKAVAKAVKKPVDKTNNKEKLEKLQAYTLEECIEKMQAMNVQYGYDDYNALLLDESDLSVLEKNIIEGNDIKGLKLNFEEVGYDEDLVMVTLTKVADTMDIKALDYKDLKQGIQKAVKFKIHKDGEVNAAQYLDEFKISEKLLMIGQRKNLVSTTEVTELIGGDVAKFFQHFFAFAYELLPEWQYNDIKFYEDFAYALLSQFADLYESDQLRVQMDVADLYIKHGDYQHGDEMYGYILRDNQIKDYIYYRYASIYKEIDFNKARSIAYSSLQYVDDRYTYYADIMEIINN